MTIRPIPYAFMALHIAVSITLVFANSGALAADMRAECPSIIPSTSIKPDRLIAGWVTVVPGQMHLKAAGMMAGPPETKTYLVPDKNTKEMQTFGFERGDGERWLWCSYGGVELARRLDDRATSCTVTTTNKKRNGLATFSASVECR